MDTACENALSHWVYKPERAQSSLYPSTFENVHVITRGRHSKPEYEGNRAHPGWPVRQPDWRQGEHQDW